MRTCEASDCENSLEGRQRSARFCSSACQQRTYYRAHAATGTRTRSSGAERARKRAVEEAARRVRPTGRPCAARGCSEPAIDGEEPGVPDFCSVACARAHFGTRFEETPIVVADYRPPENLTRRQREAIECSNRLRPIREQAIRRARATPRAADRTLAALDARVPVPGARALRKGAAQASARSRGRVVTNGPPRMQGER